MKFSEYMLYDGVGLAELVRTKQVTPQELMQAALEGITKYNPTLNAVVMTISDMADREIKRGLESGPYQGVPFLIKESSAQAADVPVNMGSRFAQGVTGRQDTNLMTRFRRAGFVTIGTTATPEFAFNFSTESVFQGPTRNPWNPERSAGGSSGGAAAAVAARFVPIAHANDGAGSIRQPAACNGLVGLKPSRGRVPVGPFRSEMLNGLGTEFVVTRTVRDTALMLDLVSGPDIGCAIWAERPQGSYLEYAKTPPRRLRIAWTSKAFNGAPVDSECVLALHETVKLLESLGHELYEAAPEFDAEAQFEATMRIWGANISHSLDKLAVQLGRTPSPDNLETSIWACYEYGKTLSAWELLDAFAINNQVTRAVGEFFEQYDVLLTPTLGQPPAPIGYMNANEPGLTMRSWTEKMMNYSPFTNLFNTTGQPAITLPLAVSKEGLPLGMQFAGRFGDEATLIQLSGQLEQAMPWADRIPQLLLGENGPIPRGIRRC